MSQDNESQLKQTTNDKCGQSSNEEGNLRQFILIVDLASIGYPLGDPLRNVSVCLMDLSVIPYRCVCVPYGLVCDPLCNVCALWTCL